MKSIQKVFSLILILVVCSCSKDDGINQFGNLDESINNFENVTRSQNPIYNTPIYSPNELIIQYDVGVSEATKSTLRAFHQVISHEVCQQCPDGRIEKWVFDIGIQIEPKKHSIIIIGVTTDIVEVDYNFELVSDIEGVDVGSSEDISYEPLIATGNPGLLTIAILDTGFDQFFPFWYEDEEPIPILYDANYTNMYGEPSGWDFINNDSNPFDDNPGKHGSVIAYELQNILSETAVTFQILPAKIFNQDGKTSYFHMVCGANYALPLADIVNMSFGWYDDGYGEFESTILENLIEEYSDVLVVTSAGNGDGDDDYEGDNNDAKDHFPSSFDLENIIAVAATNVEGTAPAPWSNYGASSVDFWAAGMDIPFYDYDYEEIPLGVQGTSFAAPQIAAEAAKHLYEDEALTPEGVIDLLDVNGIFAPFALPVHYNKYYPMMID